MYKMVRTGNDIKEEKSKLQWFHTGDGILSFFGYRSGAIVVSYVPVLKS